MVEIGKIFTVGMLVTVIVLGILIFPVTTLTTQFNTTTSAEFTGLKNNITGEFDNLNVQTSESQELSTGTDASSTSSSGFNLDTAIATFNTFWNFVGYLKNMINTFAIALGIDSIYITAFSTILVITVLLIFLSAVFGRRV